MIKGLETHMKANMGEKLEETLARNKGISIEEARQAIKEMSFMEYRTLSENPPVQGGSTAPTPQPTRTNDASQGDETPWNDKNSFDATKRNLMKPGLDASFGDRNGKVTRVSGNNVHMDMGDGAETVVPMDKLMKPTDGKGGFIDTLDDPNATSALGAAKQVAGKAMQGFQKGLQDDVNHDELNRMRELAGIEETSSAGATCAGGIAAMPSIVGDTSNSSKPTNRLKTKNRLKREKKKLKKNQDNA